MDGVRVHVRAEMKRMEGQQMGGRRGKEGQHQRSDKGKKTQGVK